MVGPAGVAPYRSLSLPVMDAALSWSALPHPELVIVRFPEIGISPKPSMDEPWTSVATIVSGVPVEELGTPV